MFGAVCERDDANYALSSEPGSFSEDGLQNGDIVSGEARASGIKQPRRGAGNTTQHWCVGLSFSFDTRARPQIYTDAALALG